MSKCLFHPFSSFTEPQKSVNDMIESFSRVINEDELDKKCRSFDIDSMDLQGIVFKEIDFILEHPDEPESIEESKSLIRDTIRKRTCSLRHCFADLEYLSYQKGIKDGFKLFTELYR